MIPATHAIWLPPGCVHGARSPGPFAGWSLYVAERCCGELLSTPLTLRISSLLHEAVARASAWGRSSRSAAEEWLAAVILDEIATLPVEPLGLPFPRDLRAVRVADGIMADPSDRRGLDAWAAEVALSPRTLSRRFSTETGFGLLEWRSRARVLRAIEHLSEGRSVTETAFQLGYNNVSAFIGAFSKTMGISPGRYLRRDRDPD